jgi:alpha-1,2-mannosyltransferase
MEGWVISITTGVTPRNIGLRLGESWIRPRFLYVTLVIALIVNIAVNAAWVATAYGSLKDLDSFLHSGAAYALGLDPYGYYGWMPQPPISPEALNLNPPISVYFFEPMSQIDRGLVGVGFLVGSIAMVAAAVGLLMRAYPDKRTWLIVLVVAGMAGVWHMLWYLQIYAPLLLAMTGAWLLLRRGDWVLAGVLLGLVIAMKPNYAVIALILLAAGHYRPAISAGATAGLISLVPLLIDGPSIYLHWLAMTQGFEGYGWTSNASLVSVGERLDMTLLGQVLAAVLGIIVLVFARKRRPGVMDATALGLMTVILLGPVSWAGYTLLLLPYLFSIRWDAWTWTSIAILVTPFAPGRALSALSIDLGSVFGASAGNVPVPVFDPWGSFVSPVLAPVVGAMYAWGVLILLAQLTRRLTSDEIPRPVRVRPRLRRLVPSRPATARPLTAGLEHDTRRQQPAPVRVRYDP